jgi:RNA exonuclease 1
MFHCYGICTDCAALAKAEEANPLMYLLTPNQMLDNDYRLPSYLAPSDSPPTTKGLAPAVSEAVTAAHRQEGEKSGIDFSATSHSAAFGNGAANGAGPSKVKVNEAGQRERGNNRGEEGWIETPQREVKGDYRVLAVDCEMVSRMWSACISNRS